MLRSPSRPKRLALGLTLSSALLLLVFTLTEWEATVPAQPLTEMIGYRAVARDAFPVFDDPKMLSVAEAEAQDAVFERDAVIGVAHKGEAKAYPITVMGVHELGNDHIGGEPITVEW